MPALACSVADMPALGVLVRTPMPALPLITVFAALAPAAFGCEACAPAPAFATDIVVVLVALALDDGVTLEVWVVDMASDCPFELCDEQEAAWSSALAAKRLYDRSISEPPLALTRASD